jgi:hypothetical protein
MEIPEYINFLEKNLMTGSARWVADFSESFRKYTIEDKTFEIFMRGSTRTKQGLFLARFFAWTMLPNYIVTCLATTQTENMGKTIMTVENFMHEKEFHWGWLVFVREGSIPPSLKNSLEGVTEKTLGVAVVDVTKKEVATSKNYLGRQMTSHLR